MKPNYVTTRPVTGKTAHGDIHIPIGMRLRHIGGDTYAVSRLQPLAISPAKAVKRDTNFTLNAHIAATDLVAEKG